MWKVVARRQVEGWLQKGKKEPLGSIFGNVILYKFFCGFINFKRNTEYQCTIKNVITPVI